MKTPRVEKRKINGNGDYALDLVEHERSTATSQKSNVKEVIFVPRHVTAGWP